MNLKRVPLRLTTALGLCAVLLPAAANAQANSWSNTAAVGFWHDSTNWSLGVAPSSDQTGVFVTNAGTKTVTIDATTSGSHPGTMTVSNLTVGGVGTATNTLFLNNAGLGTPLSILQSLIVTNGGALSITNSAMIVEGAGGIAINGNAALHDGLIVATNFQAGQIFGVGRDGHGEFTARDATVKAVSLRIGFSLLSSFPQGTMTLVDSTVEASDLIIGGAMNSTGTGAVWMTGGSIVMTNPTSSATFIGGLGVGELTISNATWLSSVVTVGRNANGEGTLTIAGGTITNGTLYVADGHKSARGEVWMLGGELVVEYSFDVGTQGIGKMTVSNGTVVADTATVGSQSGSRGILTLAGGSTTLNSMVFVGGTGNATGAIWMTGGRLVVTNATIRIGNGGVGQMTISNGTWLATNVILGSFGGSQGTLTVAGGTNIIYAGLTLGTSHCNSTGTVVVSGGSLFVTNATATALLDLESGTLIQSGGLLQFDNLVVTNSCGRFVRTGGKIIKGNLILDPSLDADGDALPNGWEQMFGLDPLDLSGDNGPGGDPDGDGFTNLQEFQAGTVPTVNISSIVLEGSNVRVTWQALMGKTNALQFTVGSGSSYSNNFSDLFTVTNALDGATNYLDVGAASAATTSRYYRVRLVP